MKNPTAAKALKKLNDTNRTRVKNALLDLSLDQVKAGK
jgi:hypothetical protein